MPPPPKYAFTSMPYNFFSCKHLCHTGVYTCMTLIQLTFFFIKFSFIKRNGSGNVSVDQDE